MEHSAKRRERWARGPRADAAYHRDFINQRVNKHVGELTLALFLTETALDALQKELEPQGISSVARHHLSQLQNGIAWLNREHRRWEKEVEHGLV